MSTTTPNTTPLAVRDDVARLARRDDLVLGGATVALGLLAGLFYGYACSVMPGLHASGDRSSIEVMQNINRAIENPVFFATFMGGPALAVWAYVGERRRGTPERARWLAWAAGLGAAGLVVTFAFNIPLNNQLEAAGDPARIADPAQVRSDFETPWVVWNVVRTVVLTGAFGCLARATFLRRQGR